MAPGAFREEAKRSHLIYTLLIFRDSLRLRLQEWIADYKNEITLQITEKRVICNRQNLRTRTPRFPIILQITGGLHGPNFWWRFFLKSGQKS